MKIKLQALQGSKVDCYLGCAKNWVHISILRYIYLSLNSYCTRVLVNDKKITGDSSVYED